MWAWPGMERARSAGHARSIGVSNFSVDELQQLLATAMTPPVVNQVQFSPYEYRRVCSPGVTAKAIVAMEAYSTLGTGRHLTGDTIVRIARSDGRTPAQVLLRWCIEHDISSSRSRPIVSASPRTPPVFDFSLSDQDMAELDAARSDRWHERRSRDQVVGRFLNRLLDGDSRPLRLRVSSAVGRQIGSGVARLGVGQGLLVPVRVARSGEAEHRPLPGRRPLDDLEPVWTRRGARPRRLCRSSAVPTRRSRRGAQSGLIVRRSSATHGEVRRSEKRTGFLRDLSSRPPPRRTSPRGGSS